MKYILVTGAFGGMGRPTTEALARNGFTVFALDRKVEESGKNIIPVQADITDEESVKLAFEKIKEQTE